MSVTLYECFREFLLNSVYIYVKFEFINLVWVQLCPCPLHAPVLAWVFCRRSSFLPDFKNKLQKWFGDSMLPRRMESVCVAHNASCFRPEEAEIGSNNRCDPAEDWAGTEDGCNAVETVEILAVKDEPRLKYFFLLYCFSEFFKRYRMRREFQGIDKQPCLWISLMRNLLCWFFYCTVILFTAWFVSPCTFML